MSELGDLLRQARESKAVSLEQAEAATRIRQKYLAALEDGDMAALPGDVYVKGFLRIYVTYLGLDPSRVLNLCPSAPVAPSPTGPSAPIRMSIDHPGAARWVGWVLLVLVIAALGVALWQFQPWKGISALFQTVALATATPETAPTQAIPPTATATEAETPPPTPDPTRSVVSPSPTGAPVVPAGGVNVKLQVTGRSWAQVTVDGQVAYSGVLSEGTREWSGARQIEVRIGDASRVDVTVNGVHLGVLGRAEEVVTRSWGPDFAGEPAPTPTPS